MVNTRTIDQSWRPSDVRPGRPGFADVRAQLAEYGGLVADGLRYLTDDGGRAPPFDLIVSLGFDRFSILRPASDRRVEPRGASFPISRLGEAGAVAAAVASELGVSRPRIAIGVDEESSLIQTVALPHAPTRLMMPLVRNAVLTSIPFPLEQGRLAFAVTSQTSDAQVVEACVLDGALVDELLASLADAGLASPAVIRIKDGLRLWHSTPSWLVGPRSEFADLLAQWKAPLRAVGLAFAIVGAAFASNLAYSTLIMAELGPDASRAIAEGRRRAALEADVQRVQSAAAHAALQLAIMEQLAARLGDGVHLEYLNLGREDVEFAAIAPSAADVIKIVGSLPGLRDPTLKSTVSRDQTRLVERFVLTARLNPQASQERR